MSVRSRWGLPFACSAFVIKNLHRFGRNVRNVFVPNANWCLAAHSGGCLSFAIVPLRDVAHYSFDVLGSVCPAVEALSHSTRCQCGQLCIDGPWRHTFHVLLSVPA